MDRPLGGMFQVRSHRSWMLIFYCFVYFAFCWGMYSVAVEGVYGSLDPPSIEADSTSYFISAGLNDPNGGAHSTSDLVSFGGSSLGPVTIALIGRNRFGVACVNCALALFMIWMAGYIPGVRREIFALLMALEPQTLPTLMSLNKEILALTGLVGFAAYIYSGPARGRRHRSKFFLLIALVFSLFARWEQIIIPLWYIAAQSRRSPVRGKPWRAIIALLLVCSFGWAFAVKILKLNLGGFIVAVKGAGLVSRLYTIQENGGYFLVALPKILMNLGGRWVTPFYFLSGYWTEEFGNNWQNQYIGILHSLVMLCMVGWTIVKGRFRLGRPLIHVCLIYFICTAVLPFIQPRYIYPGYVLLALEWSRRQEFLEPLKPLRKLPALIPSYRSWQLKVMPSAK